MRIPSIIMLYEKTKKVNEFQGSSFLLPAHGKGGAKATINNNSPSPSEKNRPRPFSIDGINSAKERAGKKRSPAPSFALVRGKRGVGKMPQHQNKVWCWVKICCPPVCPAKRDYGVGSVSAFPR